MNVYYIEKNNNTSLQTASQVPTVTNNQHSKTAMPTTTKVGCTQLPTTYKLLIFIKTPTRQKGSSRCPLQNCHLRFVPTTKTHDDIVFFRETVSPPLILAVGLCVPGHRQLAAHGRDLSTM
jgi:hypothetical protein